jgi:recA bacterial DNA recombination protein
MSSFPLFPTEAVRRPMASVASNSPAQVFARLSALPKLAEVTPASRLTVRPTPELAPSGVREVDDLTGGLPRGCLTEVCGSISSGRTSLLLAVLAAATQRQEACALVDVSDAFDPSSAAMAAVNFESMLWVRCGVEQTAAERRKSTAHGASRGWGSHEDLAPKGRKRGHTSNVEQALRVTDMLLQSGGFGLVIIDLGDVQLKIARRIPLTSWFRFQRAIEHTPTVLFMITQAPCAQTCAVLLLKVQAKKLSAFSYQPSALKTPSHAELLEDRKIETEIFRSRMPRKPAQSATAAFSIKTVRAG